LSSAPRKSSNGVEVGEPERSKPASHPRPVGFGQPADRSGAREQRAVEPKAQSKKGAGLALVVRVNPEQAQG
jgi:hypothetical protein